MKPKQFVSTVSNEIFGLAKSPRSTIRPGTGWYLLFVDRYFGRWMPRFVRSLFMIPKMADIAPDRWLFRARIRDLDERTPEEPLRKHYRQEFEFWEYRVEELKQFIQGYLYRVFETVLILFSVPLIISLGSGIWLTRVFAFEWWQSTLVSLGILVISWTVMLVFSAILAHYRWYRRLEHFADILMLNSILQSFLATFEYSDEGIYGRLQRRDTIINKIEESAKWIKWIGRTFPTKDGNFKAWYCCRMNDASDKLLELRKKVMLARIGCYEEVREALLDFIKTCLRCDYLTLIDDTKEIPGEKLSTKRLKLATTSIVVASALAIIILLILQFGFDKSVLEVIKGSGIFGTLGLALRSLMFVDKDKITRLKFGAGSFDNLTESFR